MNHVLQEYLHEAPEVFMEVFQALAPLAVVFIIFQFIVLKMRKKEFLRICIGTLYTFIGLFLFLLGIYVGFMPVGAAMGETIAGKSSLMLVPIGLALGFVVVMAEPAVKVLNDQVADVSGGNISKKVMLYTLAVGVGIAVAMSMIQTIFGFSILWYIIPGYAISIILMKFTPPVFTAIAFDSGGVASGPMTATFILAFAKGAAGILGDNIMEGAFGTVAMVAMTPLIAIQIMGVIYGHSSKEIEEDYKEMQLAIENSGDEIELYDDIDHIDNIDNEFNIILQEEVANNDGADAETDEGKE